MAKLDDGPILYSTYFEIIKLSFLGELASLREAPVIQQAVKNVRRSIRHEHSIFFHVDQAQHCPKLLSLIAFHYA